MNKYYSMEQDGDVLDVHIYGDMVSCKWFESDVTAYDLAKDLRESTAKSVNVYIDSYGGETSIGMAVYNALKRHDAEVTTYCDGFACSAASLAFMAGDKRIMNKVSLLMIHNAWTYTSGNADELIKAADDLKTISETAAQVYMEYVNITEDELSNLLDAETWIKPEEAVKMGFATEIYEENSEIPQSSVKANMVKMLAGKKEKLSIELDGKKIAEVVDSKLEEPLIIDADGIAQKTAETVIKLMNKEKESRKPKNEPTVFELMKDKLK